VFDFRYHALSLAAVLLALMIGLLLGVAIGDAGLVSSAEKNLRKTLSSRYDHARGQVSQLQDQMNFRNQFENQVYPDLVAHRLAGKRIGLIFLGQPSDQVNGLVRAALDQTGAQLVLVAVVREPPDLGALASQAPPGRYSALATDTNLLRPFAIRIGDQLVRGGQLIQNEQSSLLSTFNGSLEPLDGVVVMRNQGTLNGNDAGTVDTLENGLMTGMTRHLHGPVVGVEVSSTNPSQISWYQQQNLASVDNVDDLAGRLALVFALEGARGAYGVKPTAHGLLPNVVELPGPDNASTTTPPLTAPPSSGN
jgi:hypothetical protein